MDEVIYNDRASSLMKKEWAQRGYLFLVLRKTGIGHDFLPLNFIGMVEET